MPLPLACLLATVLGASGPEPSSTLATYRVAVTPAETLAVTHERVEGSSDVTVVLITGPVGSSFGMRKVRSALVSAGHSLLIIDPLGMGSSSRPVGADYSLAAQARRVRAALTQLLPPRRAVLLVGHATSATIALHIAADDASNVVGVASIAGGVVDRQGTNGVRLALAMAPLLDNRVGRAIGRRRFAAAARAQSVDPSWVTPDAVEGYLAPVEADLRATLRALKAMSEAVEPLSIADRLPHVEVPVRLIVGDRPLPNAPSRQQVTSMARTLRHFRVDSIRGAGTMLHEERATDVARILDEMVRHAPAPPASSR